MKRFGIPILLAAIFAVAAPAYSAEAPDANAIIRSLAPIIYLPEHGGQTKRSIDLEVTFKLGSAKLTKPARELLDRLGTALRDEKLASSRFEVVGHTDASGGRALNQALSEKRARSVVSYLIKHHRIDTKRLTALGKGEDALKDPLRPGNGGNRRVEIVNLTPVQVPKPAGPTSQEIERKTKDILLGK